MVTITAKLKSKYGGKKLGAIASALPAAVREGLRDGGSEMEKAADDRNVIAPWGLLPLRPYERTLLYRRTRWNTERTGSMEEKGKYRGLCMRARHRMTFTKYTGLQSRKQKPGSFMLYLVYRLSRICLRHLMPRKTP